MRHFKIRIGYGKGDDTFIPIDESELETALYCFIMDGKGVFKGGVCRGKDIISITEDWHKEMGWNESHVMDSDDWNDLYQKGIDKKYVGVLAEYKEKVQFLISSEQQGLIGKNVPLKELGISPLSLVAPDFKKT